MTASKEIDRLVWVGREHSTIQTRSQKTGIEFQQLGSCPWPIRAPGQNRTVKNLLISGRSRMMVYALSQRQCHRVGSIIKHADPLVRLITVKREVKGLESGQADSNTIAGQGSHRHWVITRY